MDTDIKEKKVRSKTIIIGSVHLKLLQLAMNESIYRNFVSEQFPDRLFQGNLYSIILQLWDSLKLDDFVRGLLREKFSHLYVEDPREIPDGKVQTILQEILESFTSRCIFEEVPFEFMSRNQDFQKRQREDDFEEAPAKTENLASKIRLDKTLYDSKMTELSLTRLNWRIIPAEVFEFSALTWLDLSSNNLEALPEEIGNFESLTTLSVENNQLVSLPQSIGQLAELKLLFLRENRLQSLPEEIGNLRSLEVCDLEGNRLTTLPRSLGNLDLLRSLTVEDNQLESLPREIGALISLKFLELSGNHLTELPEEIGNLIQLEKLNLNDNQLENLPVFGLISLKTLAVSDNKLVTLPDEILALPQLVEVYAENNLIDEATQHIIRELLPNVRFNFSTAQQKY